LCIYSILDVISAIKNYGFSTSPYPIILSIENHCSIKQQKRLAEVMRKILGNKLLMPGEGIGSNGLLPSPEELKYKVIVKGKRLKAEDAVQPVTDLEIKGKVSTAVGTNLSQPGIVLENNNELDNQESDEDEISAVKNPAVLKKKLEKAPHIAPDLSIMTYLGTGHVKQFSVEASAKVPCDMMCSYSEGTTNKNIKSQEKLQGWIHHNTVHLR
jgi:hypothetical protein